MKEAFWIRRGHGAERTVSTGAVRKPRDRKVSSMSKDQCRSKSRGKRHVKRQKDRQKRPFHLHAIRSQWDIRAGK